VCARLLLPGVADDLSDVQARLDRMERSLTHAPAAAAAAAVVPAPVVPEPVAAPAAEAVDVPSAVTPSAPVSAAPAASPEPGPGDSGLADVRRAWPEVLERLRELRKTPWTFIKDNTEPIAVSSDVLTLGVRSPRLRDMFAARDDYSGYLQQALVDTLGRQWRLEAVVHPGASDGPPAAAPAARPQRTSRPRGATPGSPAMPAAPSAAPEGGVEPDDQVLDEVSGADLLSRELGASVIEVVDEP
jgi:DNA polymerase-3 subunit gamma/tau